MGLASIKLPGINKLDFNSGDIRDFSGRNGKLSFEDSISNQSAINNKFNANYQAGLAASSAKSLAGGSSVYKPVVTADSNKYLFDSNGYNAKGFDTDGLTVADNTDWVRNDALDASVTGPDVEQSGGIMDYLNKNKDGIATGLGAVKGLTGLAASYQTWNMNKKNMKVLDQQIASNNQVASVRANKANTFG